MIVELCNASTEPILIKWNNNTEILQPCQIISISVESDTVDVRLLHQNNNKFNLWWYLLNVVFTLEQMRTVLVVDGKYKIKATSDVVQVKIKDCEYVFHKNTSYQLFIFSVHEGSISPQKLNVAHGNTVLNKAKFLYLFGGIKTLLPITGIALLTAILRIVSLAEISCEFIGIVIFLSACFGLLLANYIKSLKLLRKYTMEECILRYLSSERKEHRNVSDEIVRKHMDTNAGDEVYW